MKGLIRRRAPCAFCCLRYLEKAREFPDLEVCLTPGQCFFVSDFVNVAKVAMIHRKI
jgi:uncharacterized protein YlzI (FlbEa/FlbD family)